MPRSKNKLKQKKKSGKKSKARSVPVFGKDKMALELYQSSESATSRDRSNRKALCIGIDDYPDPGDRLGGCVNDAKAWKNWFASQGFQSKLLLDEKCTRFGILDAIRRRVNRGRPGDVIAIHYSGHGTQVEDFSGDEDEGLDEALVPFDHRDNGYIIDDDFADICSDIPVGVNVYFFFDTCHSGSAIRLFRGFNGPRQSDIRVRFIRADAEMQECHRQTREGHERRRNRAFTRSNGGVLFSACRSSETAKERDGHGDFTRYALTVLQDGISNLTNAQFNDRVNEVGDFVEQHPELWSDSSQFHAQFLGSQTRSFDEGGNPTHPSDERRIRQSLSEIERQLWEIRNSLD